MEPLPAAHLRAENGPSIPSGLTEFQQNHFPSNNNGLESRASRAASPEGTSTFAGQYLGPSSPYTFLRRAWKRFEKDGTRTNIEGSSVEDLSSSESIWSYGDRHIPSADLHGFRLPSRATSAVLFNYYFDMG